MPALPRAESLEDADGCRVDLPCDATVILWHPARGPDLQEPWRRHAAEIVCEGALATETRAQQGLPPVPRTLRGTYISIALLEKNFDVK